MIWVILTIIAFVLMGIGTFLMKIAVREVHPYLVLFYQYIVTIPLTLTYGMLIVPSFDILLNQVAMLLILGCFYGLALGSFYYSMALGKVSTTVAIWNMKMLITIILAVVFLNEKLSSSKVLGLGLGVIAIWLLKR